MLSRSAGARRGFFGNGYIPLATKSGQAWIREQDVEPEAAISERDLIEPSGKGPDNATDKDATGDDGDRSGP